MYLVSQLEVLTNYSWKMAFCPVISKESIFLNVVLFYVSMWCVCGHACMLYNIHGSKKITLWSYFPPSTWVPGTEHRLSGFIARTFTHRTIFTGSTKTSKQGNGKVRSTVKKIYHTVRGTTSWIPFILLWCGYKTSFADAGVEGLVSSWWDHGEVIELHCKITDLPRGLPTDVFKIKGGH